MKSEDLFWAEMCLVTFDYNSLDESYQSAILAHECELCGAIIRDRTKHLDYHENVDKIKDWPQ